MAKNPITRGYPHIEKSVYPRITDSDLRSSRDMFHWSLMLADYGGKWGFNTKLFRDKWCINILPKLLDFEKLTWGQLATQHKGRGSGTKHHHVLVSDLVKDARKR
ncbi:MAG: hypothetical protein OXF06_06685 [Bacteroidetes bacterium]|nr:hypothetical protein [Bacteroidota bacterium]